MTCVSSTAFGLIAGFVLAVCVVSTGCSGTSESPRRLAVAAASDLQFAMPELAAAFGSRHPGIVIEPSFGASGTLTAQIANGAPFDVFFSADRAYAERLAAEGHADPATLTAYATGQIVLWVANSSPLDVHALGLLVLDDPRMRTVAVANPEHAPYGRAAIAALISIGKLEAVEPKLVFGENVAQAAQFASSGAADAAIVSKSLAVSPKLSSEGRWWQFPADSHPVVEQVAVIVSTSRDTGAAREFLAFVTSAEGRAVLASHGLEAP